MLFYSTMPATKIHARLRSDPLKTRSQKSCSEAQALRGNAEMPDSMPLFKAPTLKRPQIATGVWQTQPPNNFLFTTSFYRLLLAYTDNERLFLTQLPLYKALLGDYIA